ncbi:hypothetical protein GFS31_04360 [Leptolyngbya sp. BL0902]|uniref:DUF4129 domain-containing protein n=1 Tax=Leptolyngbya sp. BL0902 TaxID=1115757 RepID=UPI0018E6E44C|nr:DUF4129 domain-containing protein [Leptolyngbya sp. BL0902]QQE63767.1 hypothetical protein GFS31_04360 [Leptolyngbya sp. BL0902]
MPPDLSHCTHSFSWQIRQTVQRTGEWFDYQFSRINIDGPGIQSWDWLEPLARGLFWLMVAGLALWLAWLLYQGGMAYLNRPKIPGAMTTQAIREEALKQAAYWWKEAQRLAQAGDYAAACKALYMAGLARLNDTETVPYRSSRTDGEYLACLEPPNRPYELLIRTHERLTFGDGQATEETYQRCRRAYQEIAQS